MSLVGYLKQSTAVDILIGPFIDDTDGKTAETGLTLDVEVSKNGQALANKSDATAPTHDAAGTVDGYYNCELDATDTGTLGILTVVAHAAGFLPVRHDYQIVTANWWDTMCSTDVLQADVTQIGGVAQSATDLKDLADTGYNPATHKLLGVVTADTTTTNTDMRGTDSVVLAGPTKAEMDTAHALLATPAQVASELGTYDAPTKAEMDTAHALLATEAKQDVIDGIVDNILIDTAVIGALGVGLTAIPWNSDWDAEVQSEVADALTAYDPPTKAEMDTAHALLATPANVATELGTYDAPTKTELDAAFTEIKGATWAAGTDTLEHIRNKLTDIEADTQAIETDTNELQTDNIPGTLATIAGYIDTEITTIDTVVDTILVDTGTTIPNLIAALENASLGDIADAVWDETLADHLGAGSTGAGLNAASSAGDPWATAIPGAYGAGTAGKILGDNIDAPISTVDTVADGIQTDLSNATDGLGALKALIDTIDGVVDTILGDTNELQTDWANDGRLDVILDAAGGAGDPWSTAIPGSYGAGTAGKILGDNINAPIGTVDTVVDGIQTDLSNATDGLGALKALIDAVQVVADAVQAKTDNLPADPADDSDIDSQLATIAGYLTTEVADILEDTGTTIPALIAAISAGGDATAANQALIIKILTNKWEITGNQLIMYDDDAVTPLYTFNLKRDGRSTEFNPDERTPV